MEPESNLANSAILVLHQRKEYSTAARANGPCLLRRSMRSTEVSLPIESTLPGTIALQNGKYLKGMKLLEEHLAVEMLADRYTREIGFVA